MLPDFLFHSEFWIYVLIGFGAQIIDGALGMAYGTLSTAILLVGTQLPPVLVSASVHTAQFFTTGISALSHLYFRNIKMRLLLILAVAGGTGGILGALLLSHIDGKAIKPWIFGYLMLVGIMILYRALKNLKPYEQGATDHFRASLGFCGGFLDAIGAGWGPIVTSNLMAKGEDPRLTIGTVNTAEFFVKTLITATFITVIGFQFHEVVLGLLVGGVLAAPLGAFILRFINPRALMVAVGALIIGLGLYVVVPAVLG